LGAITGGFGEAGDDSIARVIVGGGIGDECGHGEVGSQGRRMREELRINPPSVITARFVPLARAKKLHPGRLVRSEEKACPVVPVKYKRKKP